MKSRCFHSTLTKDIKRAPVMICECVSPCIGTILKHGGIDILGFSEIESVLQSEDAYRVFEADCLESDVQLIKWLIV